jgi:hypothetical protein
VSMSQTSVMSMARSSSKACWLPNALRKAAIFVYQLTLLYRFEYDLELCVCLKAFRKRGLMIYDRASLAPVRSITVRGEPTLAVPVGAAIVGVPGIRLRRLVGGRETVLFNNSAKEKKK